MLLHAATDDFLRGILILDDKDEVHVFPQEATSVAVSVGKSTYLFTADRTTGVLSGFSFSYSHDQVRITVRKAVFKKQKRCNIQLRNDN